MTRIQKIRDYPRPEQTSLMLINTVNLLVDALNSQEERLSKVEENKCGYGCMGNSVAINCKVHNPSQEKPLGNPERGYGEEIKCSVPQEKPEVDVLKLSGADVLALIGEYRYQGTSYERMGEIEVILTNALQGR